MKKQELKQFIHYVIAPRPLCIWLLNIYKPEVRSKIKSLRQHPEQYGLSRYTANLAIQKEKDLYLQRVQISLSDLSRLDSNWKRHQPFVRALQKEVTHIYTTDEISKDKIKPIYL